MDGSHIYSPDLALIAMVMNPGKRAEDYPLVPNRDLMAASPTLYQAAEIAEYAITEWVADTECKISHEGLIKALKHIRKALSAARGAP